MRISSLKKIKADDLGRLYVDTIRTWAKAPHEYWHSDLAVAVADELERRSKPVPSAEVRAEMDIIFSTAKDAGEKLKARFLK